MVTKIAGGEVTLRYEGVLEFITDAPFRSQRRTDDFLHFNQDTIKIAWYTRLAGEQGQMGEHYLEVISLIERLHRQFLDVIKLELETLRVQDINNVQAIMLFNLGDAEISIGELIARGYYLGSNVSYNVKKSSDSGYLVYERSEHDRRSIRVRLTPKGLTLCDQLSGIFRRHNAMLDQSHITEAELQTVTATLQRLERFWMRPGG